MGHPNLAKFSDRGGGRTGGRAGWAVGGGFLCTSTADPLGTYRLKPAPELGTWESASAWIEKPVPGAKPRIMFTESLPEGV